MKERRHWDVVGDVLTLHLRREIGGKLASISYALVDDPAFVPVTNVPAKAARAIIEQMDQFERETMRKPEDGEGH